MVASEPIAIIGMGCRLPMAANPEAYWDLLAAGRTAIREVPSSRWDANALYEAAPHTPGKMHTRWGGFLDDIDGFDPMFFRVMPIEAPRIDPQHRLVLEVAWEALEYAAIDPTALAGSLTGVYIGVSHSDHDRLLYADRANIDGYNGPNTYHCFAANRLSYFLKIRGPSLAIDGACSSSLAAIHLACQSLRVGDCDLALAGGVNLNLTPEEFIALSFLGVLSTGDEGRPFAAESDGYVRGEGCGIVVLKRLTDALAAGDNIAAVIPGSALNHNGLSNGITAPSGAAQEEVMRRALRNAGIDPKDVRNVEAMGTGTALGDPIEVAALAAVYGAVTGDGPCWASSVKANIGHLEAAAGVASLLKVILSLQHGAIPPQPNLAHLNPRLQLEGTRLDFPRACEPWGQSASGRRVAAVSAFGFGGANAHLLVEAAPLAPAREPAVRPADLLVLSAKTAPALIDLARRYLGFLDTAPAEALADICYTALVGRAHWPQRLAVAGASIDEMRAGLVAFVEGKEAGNVFTGWRSPSDNGAQEELNALSAHLGVAAERYVQGQSIASTDFGDYKPRRIPLPTYPFQRIPCRLPRD